MPEAGVSYWSVWLLGLSLGLTACTVTCLPFIATWTLGREQHGHRALMDTLAFLAGRLLAYGVLGALAGGFGAWFIRSLAGGWGNAVIGLAGIVAGLSLLLPGRRKSCAGRPGGVAASPVLLGAALTLIPCAPLATLLAACAAGGGALQGWALGSVFGLGTLLTPMLVLVPAVGGFVRRVLAGEPWLAAWLRFGAALVLLLIGARRLELFAPLLAWAALAAVLPAVTVLAWRRRPGRAVAAQPVVIHRGPCDDMSQAAASPSQ